MIILKSKKINKKIKENIETYEKLTNYGYLTCPNCYSSLLIRWGTYERMAICIDDNKIEEKLISIQRYRCKSCGKTHGILPEGLIPYKQFATDIITEVLLNPYSKNIDDIANYINYDTIKRWQKQYKNFHPYLSTMFKTRSRNEILKQIKENIIDFYRQYYRQNHRCFMQIKLLFLNMCPL